jgi:aminoglycoside phosphotransferase (APT) family kinase protein
VPTVYWGDGPDIVMERVEGPTLAEVMFNGLSPERVGRTLADLHDRLHALDWPAAGPGQSLLHLDLHPLNVVMRGSSSPVVIDWSNACPGPPSLDVAMTTLILAQVVVANDMLTSVGVPVPKTINEARLRTALVQVLRTFTYCVSAAYQDQLPTAEELRRRDPFQSPVELTELSLARDFAASLT